MILALIGPHAIGKTTAIKRWSTRYPLLKVAACDNCKAFSEGWEERQPDWGGSSDAKIAIATRLAEDTRLWICEGNTARNMPWLKVVPCVAIFHVYCAPKKFGELMKARCEKRGKEFRRDYWTDQKLWYESSQRFENAQMKGRLATKRVQSFEIKDQSRDWKYVDYAFIKELHSYGRTD